MNNENARHACIKSTMYSIHARRCFMTGEYCSKQTNVHRQRKKYHSDGEINAFVVMNFSEMSDVVYKSRIQPMIESLKEHLWLNDKTKQIACVASVPQEQKAEQYLKELSLDTGVKNDKDAEEWKQVKKINVIRADSDPASNYVACSRICQQMQIADLVIVDVSVENTNVFYEFGMAVAFGKLILPICYSGRFYAKDLEKPTAKDTRNHLGHYPWRKRLFEYYGIRYCTEKSNTCYVDARYIKDNPEFEDSQYWNFPNSEDNVSRKIKFRLE